MGSCLGVFRRGKEAPADAGDKKNELPTGTETKEGLSTTAAPPSAAAAAGEEDTPKPQTPETTNGGLPRVTSRPPLAPDVVVTAAPA